MIKDSDQRPLDYSIEHKLTRLYVAALVFVGAMLVLGQVLIHYSLNKQAHDSRVINLAGRQRMLSQNITKNVLLITDSTSHDSLVTRALTDLNKHLPVWLKVHKGLSGGYLDSLGGITVINSDTVKLLFSAMEGHLYAMHGAAEQLVERYDSYSYQEKAVLKAIVLRNEGEFLKRMDKIVFQYDMEAKKRISGLKAIEYVILITTIIVLLCEAMFIFRPGVQHIRESVHKLILSEEDARRLNEELTATNEQLVKAEGELILIERERHDREAREHKIGTLSLMEGQEKERRRLAADIHDGMGQMLTAMKLNAESIDETHMNESERVKLKELKQLIVQTISEVRAISFNLMPSVLNDFGILPALKLLAEIVSRNTQKNVIFSGLYDGPRINKNIEIGLYRIAQEAVNNSIKYAQATEIHVDFAVKSGNIELSIADDGIGFREKKVLTERESQRISNGLKNMQERAHLIDGELEIHSAPGKGTKIKAIVPLKWHE